MIIKKNREINTIYFLSIFIFLNLIYLSHFLNPKPFFSLFFFFQSFIQCSIEAICFYVFAIFFNRIETRAFLFLYIGLSFTALLSHIIDFTTIRLLDAPFSYVYKYF